MNNLCHFCIFLANKPEGVRIFEKLELYFHNSLFFIYSFIFKSAASVNIRIFEEKRIFEMSCSKEALDVI